MVKCPHCGNKGNNSYTSLMNLNRKIFDDKMIEINKVECNECHYQFEVKEIFKIALILSKNM